MVEIKMVKIKIIDDSYKLHHVSNVSSETLYGKKNMADTKKKKLQNLSFGIHQQG